MIKILFLISFCLMAIVCAYIVIYRNKFQLIFLFGKKGSGKSTLLIKMMYKYGKKGYTIYTNMTDCLFPSARIIDISMIGDMVPEPYSILCLDEVGMEYDARKFKSFKENTRDFYKLQRHYQVLCYCASQTWDVDKKVRDLTDKMYLCNAIGPISIARRIKRSFGLTDPMGEQESRIADKLKWTSPLMWMFTWIPSWKIYFDSFVAPKRPYIRYKMNETPYGLIRYRKPGKKKYKKYKIKKTRNSKQNKKFVPMIVNRQTVEQGEERSPQ